MRARAPNHRGEGVREDSVGTRAAGGTVPAGGPGGERGGGPRGCLPRSCSALAPAPRPPLGTERPFRLPPFQESGWPRPGRAWSPRGPRGAGQPGCRGGAFRDDAAGPFLRPAGGWSWTPSRPGAGGAGGPWLPLFQGRAARAHSLTHSHSQHLSIS